MNKANIVIADDHDIVRKGIISLLKGNYSIIGEANDGHEAWIEIDNKKPDAVILDLSMPGLSGLEIIKRIRKYYPKMKVLVLTQYIEEVTFKEFLDLNIDGYILKDDAAINLSSALDSILKGEKIYSKGLNIKQTGGVVNKRDTVATMPKLTAREVEILKLVVDGFSNKAISEKLFISPKTVKVHRLNIYKKLDIHSLAELTKYAIRNSIVKA